MQWIRFNARLEEKIEKAYQEWKANLATHDAKEANQDQVVEGPKNSAVVARLVDRRFIDHLAAIGVPFERP
ncbi:hypothetical protein Msil_3080 [Methylocella silvestris BL2]|uniref:Uncharacterized protein n=1 Tax=Methylocella silvestris (strain DSM 15510 / CIP 108128 / LMG 27833 / NCIMB 13906 / BL2) TaxID=395965 RepID=B8EKW1_METSB|nr:hypothetical protein [Methylocella silvestris]ACK51989.1 hypothetical protein Msil_3080 [Methylocella silvestris BL2]